jgi:hypothetical protein
MSEQTGEVEFIGGPADGKRAYFVGSTFYITVPRMVNWGVLEACRYYVWRGASGKWFAVPTV